MTDFIKTKSMFHLPEGMIYLDGNSLGPLPKAAADRISKTVNEEWGEMLITGWNKAGWMGWPTEIGDRIAKLIGAADGTVVVGDTLSIKVYQALASALEMRPDRKVILSDTGNFPSDLYMANGLAQSLGNGHVVETVAPEDVAERLSRDVAVLMITEADYRTGRLHDMEKLTQKAHEVGALTVWDLAHTAGAIPINLAAAKADFAVGCTYKYLNAGPGGPAFIYVSPKHLETARPALSGWLGHAAPFSFDPDYRAGTGIERMRVGTPPILQMAALEAALDVWDVANIHDVRAKSIELTELFISQVETLCPTLTLVSPRIAANRGSQVTFTVSDAYAVMQALIARGVVGDFREPDLIRFGFTPLFIDENDVREAARILGDIMKNRLWDNPEYKIRNRVT